MRERKEGNFMTYVKNKYQNFETKKNDKNCENKEDSSPNDQLHNPIISSKLLTIYCRLIVEEIGNQKENTM